METINNVLELFLPHWPFIATMSVFSLMGTVMNNSLFSKAQASKKRKGQCFFWWGRRTLPLHPLVTGFVVGIFWRNPEAEINTWVESSAYFAFSGVMSVFAYEVLKGLAKKKGISLNLPGDSNPPTTPPKGSKP